MINKLKKTPILFCIILILICIDVPYTAYAVTATKELFEADSQKNYSVFLSWDTERPEVHLISPEGEQINVFDTTSPNLQLADEFAIYTLINPDSGQWSVSCDKKNNTEVEISVNEKSDGIWIDSFVIDTMGEDSAEVSFKVTAPDDYKYEISAILNDDKSVSKSLESGTNNSAEKSLRVSLSDLNSYNNYRLMLTVTLENTELIITDTAVSEPFNYNSEYEKEAPLLEDLYITVNTSTNIIDISDNSYFSDEYLMRYKTDIGEEQSEVFENSTSILYEEDATKIDIFVREGHGDKYSKELPININFGDNVSYDWSYNELIPIATPTISVQTNNAIGCEAIAIINGIETPFVIEEEVIKFDLIEGQNKISMNIIDKNGINWLLNETIYLDSTAPNLRFFEDYNDKTVTTPTIIIVGEVEPNAKLTMNGADVNIEENGDFCIEVHLRNNKNNILFEASDVAGNKESYSPCIIYNNNFWTPKFVYIMVIAISGFVSALLIFLCIRIIRKK